MAVRKLDNKGDGPAEFSALATAAITNNPAPGKYPGGLFVKFDTDPNYFVICGAGEEPIGTLHYNVAAGSPAQIRAQRGALRLITLGDTVTVSADGTAFVTSDAYGKAVTAGSKAASAGKITKAGVVGDVVPLLFNPTAADTVS